MARDPVLKASTLAAQARSARQLGEKSLTDRNPSWGDDQLRRELSIIAECLEWALRRGKDPTTHVLRAAEGRRRRRERARGVLSALAETTRVVAEPCPREPDAHLLSDGALLGAGADDFRAHLADCLRCQATLTDLADLEVLAAGVREGAGHGG